ncbi:unnamed protein product [Lymnaea stagnalis]|uniref:Uncharacterized protein n=1 Tax=Lymnaea stagnalis TaxID=6523 RepID=A0AAV2HR23_LYMST
MASSTLFLLCLMAPLPMFLSQQSPEGADVRVLTEEQFCELLKKLSSLAEGIKCSDLFENEDIVRNIADAISRKPPTTEPLQRDDNIELNHLLLAFLTEHVKNLVEDAGHEPPAEMSAVRAGRAAADTEARHLSRRRERHRHRNGGRGSHERHGGDWRGGVVPPPPPVPFLPPNWNGVPVIPPFPSIASPIVNGRKRSLESEHIVKRQLQTQKALVNATTRSAPRRLRQGDVTRRVPFNVDQFGIQGNRKSDKKSQVTPEALSGSAVTPASAKPSAAGKQGKSRPRPSSNPRIFPQRG